MRALVLPTLLFTLGCYPPSRYPLTPASADDSTYEVFTAEGQGTAWVVSPGYLVTAGHVCAGATDSGRVWLRSNHGIVIQARPVMFETSADATRDACVLVTSAPLADPLILAPALPKIGEADFLVSYPGGERLMSRGVYLGEGRSTTEAHPGSSGGAVSTAEGVYMILDVVPTDLTAPWRAGGTELPEIRQLLDMAGVPWYTY